MASSLLHTLLGIDPETAKAQAEAKTLEKLSTVKVEESQEELRSKKVANVLDFADRVGIKVVNEATGAFDEDAWNRACAAYERAAGKTN